VGFPMIEFQKLRLHCAFENSEFPSERRLRRAENSE